jgi:predicted PurR-regulated permease PerM
MDTDGQPYTLSRCRDVTIIAVLAVAGLYYGKSFLLPLVSSLLGFVLLTSLSDNIARQKIFGRQVPHSIAVLISFSFILVGFVVIYWIIRNQLSAVIAAIPRYEERFATIFSNMVSVFGEDHAKTVSSTIMSIDFRGWALGILGSAGSFIQGLFLLCLYIPFMAVERSAMLRKIPLAVPSSEVAGNILALTSEISLSLQRYIGVKSLVSLLTALLSFAIMKALGLDFAETWAVLTFALNFIPSIGSVLALILPAIVALVQFDSLAPFLTIVVVCGTIQFSIGNILEPALTGRSLNLSPIMVIVALTFWGTIWGPTGALLSVPMTACLVIVLSYVPSAKWIAILASRDGTLISHED